MEEVADNLRKSLIDLTAVEQLWVTQTRWVLMPGHMFQEVRPPLLPASFILQCCNTLPLFAVLVPNPRQPVQPASRFWNSVLHLPHFQRSVCILFLLSCLEILALVPVFGIGICSHALLSDLAGGCLSVFVCVLNPHINVGFFCFALSAQWGLGISAFRNSSNMMKEFPLSV